MISAGQGVIQEYLLQGKNINSELVVGIEGIWGVIIVGCIKTINLGIFMPIAQFIPGKEGESLHEDTLDSFYMLYNNHTLLIISIAVVIGMGVFNMSYMEVTFVIIIII